MDNQSQLFNTDYLLTNGQKFNKFFANFVKENNVKIMYTTFYYDKIAINTVKNIYTSHVIEGGWNDDKFSYCLKEALDSGKKIHSRLLEEIAIDYKREK